jgi:Listeria-Bacteroides repeat domain (List_Bact_rpt).
MGWNTKPDGSGTNYKDGAKILGSAITKDFTLYAMWAMVITYDGNGADGGTAMAPQEIFASRVRQTQSQHPTPIRITASINGRTATAQSTTTKRRSMT